MKILRKKENGVTIIALIITIIVLLILTGVVIGSVTSDEGIFIKTKIAAGKYTLKEVEEKLETAISKARIKNKGRCTLDEFLEELIDEDLIDENDIIKDETDPTHKAEVIIDGKLFIITWDESGNINYEYQGEATDLQPTVKIEISNTTTNKIEVKVKPKYATNEQYEYYIKKQSEDDSKYQKDGDTTTETTHTFSGLTTNVTYTVKVILKVSGKNDAQANTDATTGTITQASGATYTPQTLTNGNVTVTLPTIEGFTTRYTTDGSSPTTSSTEYTGTITISSNCTIKYVYSDGNNVGGEDAVEISNIDKTNPAQPTISLATSTSWATNIGGLTGSNWTSGAVTVTLSSTDASGIKKYQISTDNANWTDITGNKYTFSTKGAYTRYFRAVDNANNPSSSASTNFTIYTVGSSITLANFTGKTITLSGSATVPLVANAVNLVPGNKYKIEFDYVCASGTNTFDCDLYPDDLPQVCPVATTTKKHLTWILTSSSSNMSSCSLRIFDDIQETTESDITITNITLTEISV